VQGPQQTTISVSSLSYTYKQGRHSTRSRNPLRDNIEIERKNISIRNLRYAQALDCPTTT